jgi:7-carboxy-7-deazaguanine synthase
METAPVIEIFSGIQGEGLFAGSLNIFVRFAGCDLNCSFCDTPEAREPESGTPIAVEPLIKEIEKLEPQFNRVVALTGGEPLTHASFIATFLRTCRREGRINLPYLLETNGCLPAELEKVIPYIDVISMDIKLPGVYGGPAQWYEHAEFLKIAALKEVYVKVPVDITMSPVEFMQAVDLVKSVNRDIRFYIQPVTPPGASEPRVKGADLLDYARAASKELRRVAVMPQLHRVLGVK